MRAKTELELFPYLHSKLLCSEHVTFAQKKSTLQRSRGRKQKVWASSFTSFKQQSLFNDTILLYRKSGKYGIDKYK